MIQQPLHVSTPILLDTPDHSISQQHDRSGSSTPKPGVSPSGSIKRKASVKRKKSSNVQPPRQAQQPHAQLSIDRVSVSPQPQMLTRMLSPQPHSSFFQFTEVHGDDYLYKDDSEADLVRIVPEFRPSNDKAVQVPQDLLKQAENDTQPDDNEDVIEVIQKASKLGLH